MGNRWALASLLVIVVGGGITLYVGHPELEPRKIWVSDRLARVPYSFTTFGTSNYGQVWGASGAKLFRIYPSGREVQLIAQFEQPITAIHHMSQG